MPATDVTESGPIARLKITHEAALVWVGTANFRLNISGSPASAAAMALLAVLKDAFLAGRIVTVEGEKQLKTGLVTLESVDLSR